MKKHTSGPWYWETESDGVVGARLMAHGRGGRLVMGCVRKGFNRAQPEFAVRDDPGSGGILYKADELDLRTHPDALLIAAAPDLLEACLEARAILADSPSPLVQETVKRLTGAINKAEGAAS